MLHNTLLISGTYANAIEYRFANTTAVSIAYNAADARVVARDGATGAVAANYTAATAAMFVDPANGDLHLRATATALLDQVAAPAAAAGPDWDGEWRPAGTTDLGADEHRPGAPPRPPVNLRVVN